MPYHIDIKANIKNVTDPTNLLIEVIMPNQAKYFYNPLIHHFKPSGPYSYKLNSFIVLEENAWSGKKKKKKLIMIIVINYIHIYIFIFI